VHEFGRFGGAPLAAFAGGDGNPVMNVPVRGFHAGFPRTIAAIGITPTRRILRPRKLLSATLAALNLPGTATLIPSCPTRPLLLFPTTCLLVEILGADGIRTTERVAVC